MAVFGNSNQNIMSNLVSSIKVLSANCQGLRNQEKRTDVLSYFKESGASIVCLQDTHLTQNDTASVRQIWPDCYVHGTTSNSRGVAILLNDNFEYKVLCCKFDNIGNYLQLIIMVNSLKINLITLYAPNQDDPNFFNEIDKLVNEEESDYVILCGDFNLVLDSGKDCRNYVNINNPKARDRVSQLISDLELADIFRVTFPNSRRYTWRRKNPLKQARLDYFLISNSMRDIITKCSINPSYRSDHSIIEIQFAFHNFQKGRGIWKFNNSLLKQNDYLKLINRIINEEKVKYSIPVCDMKYLESNDEDIQFVISPDLFFETLLMRIRGETIKYASVLKKSNNRKEISLIKDIENLESMEESGWNNTNLLESKKQELQDLRKNKISGQALRAKAQWLNNGEKPSKFFCMLENKNFVDKTIRKLKLDDGSEITEQSKILTAVKDFYHNLFENKDQNFEAQKFEKLLNLENIRKISVSDLGKKITATELGNSLNKMKNDKSPGIDGFTAEFFRVFWKKLKFFVMNAINFCYTKGQMALSWRQSIITCLPKGTKDRTFLKNWRPISLLCVPYKIISGVIAERIKPYLDQIISQSQSGYIKGRNMAENTRLIYDLMHYTEK